MTMSNLHPGFILIAVGLIALFVPKSLRRPVLAAGPLLGLGAVLTLAPGTNATLPFINGITLHYLHVDALSWIFALIFCMMAAIGGIYACHNSNRMEAFCSMTYAGSALGVTLAQDWLTLIFFSELMAATSLFLIWCKKTPASRQAGYRYLLVHMFGGNLLLAGIFLKVSAGDYLVMPLAQGPWDTAFWLICLGISINAAVVPLHAWLVDAYPEGTVTGSVFLSSFTTKVAVYCLIRIFAGTDFLIWFGVLMALYGACYAIMENDMRRLLSYHIVSQVGFMVAGVGLGTAMALNGATAHAFSHILYKSLLFMCAGAIIYATGIRKINQLGGLAKKMPFMMYLPKMAPHTALSLDPDWFYRKPFAGIVTGLSYLCCAVSRALGNTWEVLYEKSMELSHNPMEFLDAKPLRNSPKYNPENYRTSIADPIMITLTILFCSLCYFMAII